MKTLFPFVISFFIPGAGQLILRDLKKGVFIILLNLLLIYILFGNELLEFIPFWAPHIILMIWSLFDIYDKIEQRNGKKSATRNLAFSVIIVVILIPLTLYLLAIGISKGATLFVDGYLNEDRTKEEMNNIALELEAYKSDKGKYPDNYQKFVSKKPIWYAWKSDSWKNPYKYELTDSLNYKLISAGKDEIYFTEDDLIRSND